MTTDAKNRSASDTPRSDRQSAICSDEGFASAGCYCVGTEFARDLERQNNKLRDALMAMLAYGDSRFPDNKEAAHALAHAALKVTE